MKQNKLVYTMAGLGAVLLALRLGLYSHALDEKNLLKAGHPLSLLIWTVTGAALVLTVLGTLREKKGIRPLQEGLAAALGNGIFALAIGFTVLSLGEPISLVEKGRALLGYLCAACLLYAAFCRVKGKPVFFGCFAAVCVFFVLHLLSSYRDWSGNPQLQDYVFSMLTCASAALFAYQSCAESVGIGNAVIRRISGLLTVCFGLAAVYPVTCPLLYGASAVWALGELIAPCYQGKREAE